MDKKKRKRTRRRSSQGIVYRGRETLDRLALGMGKPWAAELVTWVLEECTGTSSRLYGWDRKDKRARKTSRKRRAK